MVRAVSIPMRVAAAALLLGATLLGLAMVPVGPDLLGGLGALVVSTAYAWLLAVRTGGRPLFFGALVALMGAVVLVVDTDWLRTGAAVLTCASSAVLGVLATVPARRFHQAIRECVVAVLVAALGGLATVGWQPVLDLQRFEYATLALGLAGTLAFVYRLGAGLHGLGRRGAVAVVVVGIALFVFAVYAELLRRYGSGEVVDHLFDIVRWSREHLGAFPRQKMSLLGIPALAWGCHLRARRRQGWWVCAFGVVATTPVAAGLVNPHIGLTEVGLSFVYSLIVGLTLGYLVIRIDLAVTGPRGRRARRAEEEAAARPEPPRTHALF